MKFSVQLTQAELDETGKSVAEFTELLYELLENSEPSLPGYNIDVQVVAEE